MRLSMSKCVVLSGSIPNLIKGIFNISSYLVLKDWARIHGFGNRLLPGLQ